MKRRVRDRTTIKYFAVFLLAYSSTAFAEAYVDASQPFIEIKDVNQQAEAWAVCAAAYDIMATIQEADEPAKAKQLDDLGNGAQLAVGMTLVIDDLEPDISLERFKALWENSQAAMNERPQAQLAAIIADAAKLGTERKAEFGRKINATVVTCINNLAGQRMYIDTWQELVKSGLLQLPQVE